MQSTIAATAKLGIPTPRAVASAMMSDLLSPCSSSSFSAVDVEDAVSGAASGAAPVLVDCNAVAAGKPVSIGVSDVVLAGILELPAAVVFAGFSTALFVVLQYPS